MANSHKVERSTARGSLHRLVRPSAFRAHFGGSSISNNFNPTGPPVSYGCFGIPTEYFVLVRWKLRGNSIIIGPRRSRQFSKAATVVWSKTTSPDDFRTLALIASPFGPTCNSYTPSPRFSFQGTVRGYCGIGPLITVPLPRNGDSTVSIGLASTWTVVITSPFMV